jgi:hypothetical protein
MTTDRYLRHLVLPVAYALLPKGMGTDRATAMLMSIALQESKCIARKQKKGPARSFWQFEAGGGVKGVLTHESTKRVAADVLNTLSYAPWTVTEVYEAITSNDVLAAVFARLLLWTDPQPLPPREDASASWRLYIRTWRPGKPRPHEWPESWAKAWALTEG